MKGKKKQPARSSGSRSNRKTTTRKSSSSAKAGKSAAAPDSKKLNSSVRDEIVAIILVAVGIFFIIAFQTEAAGSIGLSLSHFFKGLFGFAAHLLPYYFILYGVLLFMRKTIHVGVKSAVLLLIIFLMISLINSARFIDEAILNQRFWNVSVYYNNGMALDDGGAFGMMVGKMIVSLVGVPGLYIFSIVVIFICLLLIMNTPVSRFFEKAKERREKRREMQAEREKEKLERKAEQLERRQQQKQAERERMAGYGPETVEAAERSRMTARQKKILGYIRDEGPEQEKEDEILDFSLGEDREKKNGIGTGDRDEEARDDRFGRGRGGEREGGTFDDGNEDDIKSEGFGTPIIVGGFSPKKMEEKLTKAEAEKSMLKEEDFNVTVSSSESYRFPPIDLLNKPARKGRNPAEEEIKNLSDDIALNMEAKSIRIEAPIPGKPAVGIEIENERINMVTIREIIDSAAFKKSQSKITFAVGKDIAGKAIVADLKTMPHLLIAGSTGSGKSVCINSIIASILYKARPDEVKLVLIDPKVVELANYNGIPHLLIPVVTEPAKAAAALNWAVAEMDDRYKKFAEEGVRELASYNKKMAGKGEEESVMPQVVIIIDELADLMMAAPSQVEESICRLAQKARAAGMHLIVATQRPSVDVITGVIKANIPSRIAFAVSSQFDSRTILDMSGAEKLVGKGDMLFNPLGSGKPVRVQGAFISDKEVNDLIEFVKDQVEEAEYSENVMDSIERANMPDAEKGDRDLEDELLPDAIELVVQAQQASVSMLQRRFRIGYNRAARIIDMMEDRQIVGPSDGSRPRQVLISEEDLMNMQENTKDMEEE